MKIIFQILFKCCHWYFNNRWDLIESMRWFRLAHFQTTFHFLTRLWNASIVNKSVLNVFQKEAATYWWCDRITHFRYCYKTRLCERRLTTRRITYITFFDPNGVVSVWALRTCPHTRRCHRWWRRRRWRIGFVSACWLRQWWLRWCWRSEMIALSKGSS